MTALLKQCAKSHKWEPGALDTAIAAYEALSPLQKKKADAIYRTLLDEPSLPVRPEAKLPYNREQINRDFAARRRLEEMAESRAIASAHGYCEFA